ncbi:MAG: 4Fe-4S binding protein [Salibacteraceae bacterium]
MKQIQFIGLGLFAIALSVFITLPFGGSYEIDADEMKIVIKNPTHYRAMEDGLRNMVDKEYSSQWLMVRDYRLVQDVVNHQYESSRQWDQVIYVDYAFDLIKTAEKGVAKEYAGWLFLLVFILGPIGALLYILPQIKQLAGIKNDHVFHDSVSTRGWLGMLIGFLLIAFYIVLYWFPEYITNWVLLVDWLSVLMNGSTATQWFLYGFMYTIAIVVMGVRMLIKYRHSNYHMVRTVSVIFFQAAFAFTIPQVLSSLSLPSPDLKNMWPLDYSFFFDYRLNEMIQAGTIGYFMLGWGVLLFVIGVPLFTYFYGKRWYCSWVCGCGGLAETAGDPFRQLSNKKLAAWKLERWMVHGVLLLSVLMTAAVLFTFFSGESELFSLGSWYVSSYDVRGWYGFAIGSAFAGVIGTGFYPLLGNRVWCRFGCPLAAYLGIVQRFKSRFRITTNGGQCISCGNCSTYCEMGIDVRWYAQRGQNIVRSSCVGCGVCSSVCPRGVLKLESGVDDGSSRTEVKAILLGNEGIKLNL